MTLSRIISFSSSSKSYRFSSILLVWKFLEKYSPYEILWSLLIMVFLFETSPSTYSWVFQCCAALPSSRGPKNRMLPLKELSMNLEIV